MLSATTAATTALKQKRTAIACKHEERSEVPCKCKLQHHNRLSETAATVGTTRQRAPGRWEIHTSKRKEDLQSTRTERWASTRIGDLKQPQRWEVHTLATKERSGPRAAKISLDAWRRSGKSTPSERQNVSEGVHATRPLRLTKDSNRQ